MGIGRGDAERRLAALREIEVRRATDPLFIFKPFPGGQSDFIHAVLSGETMENWFLAANRSGKSDAGAVCGASLARFGNQSPFVRYVRAAASEVEVRDRSTSGWVGSLDFPSSRDIIQPKYFNNNFVPPNATHEPFIPEREIKEWRVSDQVLLLKNGSIIGFKSADSGPKKFQGAEKDWVHFDEEPPETVYNETVIRVGGKRRLRVFGTCTLLPPAGQAGGVTWVFDKKVKPFLRGLQTGVRIFRSSIYENTTLDREEIARLESIYPEGSIERRIRLNGELVAGSGGARIYAGFQHNLNVREQPAIAFRRPLAWVWDFNIEPLVSLIGQREGRIFRVFHEIILDEGSLPEMCERFRMMHPAHLAEIHLYGDSHGKDRSTHDKRSSYQVILNEMRGYPAPIRLRVPEANPPVTARINAVNRICRTETGESLLEIDPRCEELISDLEQVIGDGRGGIKKTTNKSDPYFKRTHTSDALGYWVHMEEPVRPFEADRRSVDWRKMPMPIYGRRAPSPARGRR